jgi:hypothetical protein
MAKIVVPGSLTKAYQKREGDFSPDLVGNQFTSGNAFFTFGNFSITTNTSNTTGEFFNTGEFSEIITLDSLQITESESKKITEETNNLTIKLKTNPYNLKDYVYFSDARKFIETEIVDILGKWKGGIFIPFSYVNSTVVDFSYNSDKNISYFTVPVSLLENPYNLTTENLPNLVTQQDDISFLQSSFKNYEIYNDYGKFKILSYTGNNSSDDYIKIETEGLTWPTLLSSGQTESSFKWLIRPSDNVLDELFFNNLSPFQTQLLNKNSLPEKYTISLNKESDTPLGQPANSLEDFTWPLVDGYNLAYNGIVYGNYIEKLLRFAAYFDSEITNIMVRRLVAKAIFEFDTPSNGTDPNSGQKMSKLVKIWGREYDKIKTYIDSISFANVLTYDGIENTPDELIKLMANNLGFDTLQSFSDNNLIKFFQTTSGGVFNEQQTNMSLSEMDREFWRRLVINAWWLFKSKGTRKVIEFFLNLFNIDECLVDLNEIVYVAENKLNYPDVVELFLNYYGFIPNENQKQIDDDGYPKILPNTQDYYFQLNGYWYDGGVEPNTKPDVKGNNPHFGPYDFGKAYFEKFTCLLEGFDPVVTTTNLNLLTFNYFTDYTLGTIEGTGQVIVEGDNVVNTTNTGVGNTLTNYNSFYADEMNTTNRVENAFVQNAGSSSETSNNGLSSFHINFFTGDEDKTCLLDDCPDNIQFLDSGLVSYVEQNGIEYVLEDVSCCEDRGHGNYFNINDGTTPCYWCPPLDAVVETVTIDQGTVLSVINSSGGNTNLADLPSDCCNKRGGEVITPTSVGSNGELVLEKPYCKKAPIVVDPNESNESTG